MERPEAGLRGLCAGRCGLGEADIRRLEALEGAMQYMADLTGADVFIDCLDKENGVALVVAQASPGGALSAYTGLVVGSPALPENEPAVYHAFSSGLVVRDLKAITQENQSVMQDIVPVRGEEGGVVAVLIKEQDVSRQLRQQEKYRSLAAQQAEVAPAAPPDTGMLPARELHHRVKNNLQMVASMLNIQARRAQSEEVRQTFLENASRVLSITNIYDIMLSNKSVQKVELGQLVEKMRAALLAIAPPGLEIDIAVAGDTLWLDTETAGAVSVVVNELLTNCIKHAFVGRSSGRIRVLLQGGHRYNRVVVEDDGAGFDPAKASPGSLGMEIVSALVRDKLQGEIKIQTDQEGTRAYFSFLAGRPGAGG